MSHAQHPKKRLVENKLSVIPTTEPECGNLLRSPGIDSQPYLTNQLASSPGYIGCGIDSSIPENRFLGSLNLYKYGLCLRQQKVKLKMTLQSFGWMSWWAVIFMLISKCKKTQMRNNWTSSLSNSLPEMFRHQTLEGSNVRVMHGLINYIDGIAKCLHLKNWPLKGFCSRCLSVCFCLGWSSNFAGSGYDQIHSVKLLQNMISNTTVHKATVGLKYQHNWMYLQNKLW